MIVLIELVIGKDITIVTALASSGSGNAEYLALLHNKIQINSSLPKLYNYYYKCFITK